MSLDAIYLMSYDNLPYVEPTPMQLDIIYLKEKYEGTFITLNGSNCLWHKPKYLLPREELNKLLAYQVLERRDCELWEIIK